MSAERPLISQEEVASVLAREERAAPAAAPGAGPTVYSLRRPMALAAHEEPEARTRIERIAAGLAGSINRELNAEISLEVSGFQQELAATAIHTLPQPAWILAFLEPGAGGVALALDPGAALALVELALGGIGSNSSGERGPTPLEARVLDKLCRELSAPLAAGTEIAFDAGAFCRSELPARLAAPGQTVGVALLKIRIAETERNGLLVATPDLLRRRSAGSGEPPTIGPLARRLEAVRVEVRPVLDAGFVSLADLAAVAPGTVLALDAPERRRLVLRVNRREVFRGRVVHENGRVTFHVDWRRARRRTVRKGVKP